MPAQDFIDPVTGRRTRFLQPGRISFGARSQRTGTDKASREVVSSAGYDFTNPTTGRQRSQAEIHEAALRILGQGEPVSASGARAPRPAAAPSNLRVPAPNNPLDPQDAANRQRLLAMAGAIPGRSYTPDTVSAATPAQVAGELASWDDRARLGATPGRMAETRAATGQRQAWDFVGEFLAGNRESSSSVAPQADANHQRMLEMAGAFPMPQGSSGYLAADGSWKVGLPGGVTRTYGSEAEASSGLANEGRYLPPDDMLYGERKPQPVGPLDPVLTFGAGAPAADPSAKASEAVRRFLRAGGNAAEIPKVIETAMALNPTPEPRLGETMDIGGRTFVRTNPKQITPLNEGDAPLSGVAKLQSDLARATKENRTADAEALRAAIKRETDPDEKPFTVREFQSQPDLMKQYGMSYRKYLDDFDRLKAEKDQGLPSGPKRIATKAEYDALPAGTRYIDAQGRPATKGNAKPAKQTQPAR